MFRRVVCKVGEPMQARRCLGFAYLIGVLRIKKRSLSLRFG
jgi:hypothetical protein